MTTNDDERKLMATKREVKVHGKVRWEVDFGKDPLTGDKKRKYCESESEADKAISDYDKEVKRNGEYWARLMPGLVPTWPVRQNHCPYLPCHRPCRAFFENHASGRTIGAGPSRQRQAGC